MLRWRLLFGTIFIAAFVGLCVLDYRSGVPGSWLFPLALVVSIALAKEMVDLLTTETQQPFRWSAYLGTLLVVLSNAPSIYLGVLFPFHLVLGSVFQSAVLTLATFNVCIIVVFAVAIFRFLEGQQTVTNVALTILVIAYVGILISATIQLLLVFDPVVGLVLLVSLIAVVKCADIGAYTVGRLFGKHKLAPQLSPGKTIEGAIGALIFAVLASFACFYGLVPFVLRSEVPITWWTILIPTVYGLLIGVSGIMGDLAESLIKRDAGKKDSSDVLPGFGGVFDLLDSILFAAPVALIFWLAFLVWQ